MTVMMVLHANLNNSLLKREFRAVREEVIHPIRGTIREAGYHFSSRTYFWRQKRLFGRCTTFSFFHTATDIKRMFDVYHLMLKKITYRKNDTKKEIRYSYVVT